MIKSRLLQQIERDIAAASTPLAAAGLSARRAIALARHGQLDAAREQMTALHRLAFQHPGPQFAAWLHLAEGLIGYFTDFGEAASGKIEHAQALAEAAHLPEVIALGLSWRCQLALVHQDPAAFAPLAVQARNEIAPEQHSAQARLAMAIGMAHHYAGRADLAPPWYAKVRAHALAEGDDAMLSALIYNTAEMRTAQARHQALSGVTVKRPELLLGADSVVHYDAAVGGSAMEVITPILRARVLVLQEQFEAALALYEAHLPSALAQGLARLSSNLLADLAWCRLMCGQPEAARRQAEEAELEFNAKQDIDDRAAAHTRLAQVYRALNEPILAEHHATLAREAWAGFAENRVRWAQALSAPLLQRP